MRTKLCTTLAVAALALSACGDDEEKKSGGGDTGGETSAQTQEGASTTEAGQKYPEQIRTNFITACDDQPNAPKAVCECALEKIEEKYSLEEFREIDEAQREGAKTPDEITAIVKDCVAEES